MKKVSPKVSIIIPTYNEEKNIGKCLTSIFHQNYPISSLEVIMVDDKSEDKTVEIAKRFPINLLYSGKKYAEISKMIGFKRATGEYAVYLDADIELRGKNWLKKMLKPLLEDESIIGSFTKYYNSSDSPAIERYLNFDPLQRDSIYQFFSPSIDDVIVERRNGYFVCKYDENKIPPAGLCVYRRIKIMKLIKNFNMFLELDFLVLFVRNGFNKFAYVPDAGLFHHHASSLLELINKRKYNLTKVYFTHVQNRLYTWFDLGSTSDRIKIILWIFYANLIAPSLLFGAYKSVRFRDWAGMYEPLITLVITDYLIFIFLKSRKGRELILKK